MSLLASFPLFSLQQFFLYVNGFGFTVGFVEESLLAVDWFGRYCSFEVEGSVRIKF